MPDTREQPNKDSSEQNGVKQSKKTPKHIRVLRNALIVLVSICLIGWAVVWTVERKLNRTEVTSIIDQYVAVEDDEVILQNEEIVVKKDELVKVDASDLSANKSLGTDVINILLLGTDSRTDKINGLTDTMIICSIDPAKNTIKLISIMRDTWVSIPGHSKGGKINAANVYGGPNLAIKTVNEAYDMNIEDYVLVNMQSMIAIIDEIGGIEIDINEDEMKQVNRNLDGYRGDLLAAKASFDEDDFAPLTEFGEKIHVNGQQALAFARIRKLDSDYVRAERQRNMLLAVGLKAKSGNVLQLANLVGKLFPYVSTSMKMNEIIPIGTAVLNMNFSTMEQMQLPSPGTFQSGTYNGTWCIRPNFDKNKRLLHEFIYGSGEVATN